MPAAEMKLLEERLLRIREKRRRNAECVVDPGLQRLVEEAMRKSKYFVEHRVEYRRPESKDVVAPASERLLEEILRSKKSEEPEENITNITEGTQRLSIVNTDRSRSLGTSS
ncbi:hypothetical protein ISN45_Aa01g007120 [Arabidopsis thaliana x Arabidopsis arenosa]|uniref:Uncharacterized protein n=1 Tax=Arabidopsis thaliana x Arabidopsis arenosa TaxID=1240361 RepID=A0A8T2BWC1_9BRAS|nr:hypothetical protein ISN45_Aa01g007120 [Arabidopsis thaliana x Arabidopsis arenosa]